MPMNTNVTAACWMFGLIRWSHAYWMRVIIYSRPPMSIWKVGSTSWLVPNVVINVYVDEDEAPYKHVVTHGFTIDDKGRKMSKSLATWLIHKK